MLDEPSAEPLYDLIRKIRQPTTLRELMAACLRSIYVRDPFMDGESVRVEMPNCLLEEVSVREETVAGIRCAIYSPRLSSQQLPLMLYLHGGGFVVGCSEDTDYVTRMLCYSNQIVVLSINYRLAPETVFPGALNDCEQILTYATDQRSHLGIDPKSVYLAGDSAGANLALALYQKAQQHRDCIKGIVLLAPWLDMHLESYNSFNLLAPTGIVFDAAFLAYARAAYVGFDQWKNPLVSPLLFSPCKMPRTIILIGTQDPLVGQTIALEQRVLESNCEQIEFAIYPGMPHCFYSFPGLFDEERDCYKRISDFISAVR